MSMGSHRSSSGSEKNTSSAGASTQLPPLSREHSSASAKAAADEKIQAPHQRSPKRLLSSPVPIIIDRPRRNSPAGFNDRDETLAKQVAKFADEERKINRSVPPNPPVALQESLLSRAETLPSSFEGEVSSDGSVKDGPAIVTPQHVFGLLEASSEEILLLDLRVSTQYASSRIAGALNLCIPTTLLKRASFNVQKLSETFKDPEQRTRFERWRSSRYIIVYDQNTSLMKDASTCVNTLKKFAAEGFNGYSYIIRGGYTEFASKFPSLVVRDDAGSDSPSSTDSERPAVAPVVGGCPMPATQSAANPFFGNIRQNMDLIGGVGQQTVKHPEAMTQNTEHNLPRWLREAADPKDNGKRVADKFLAIEKKEQKRMQDALSSTVQYGSPTAGPRSPRTPLSPSGIRRHPPGGKVQIAGVEKGAKNRYNNIWPFEHSRVKLQGVPTDGCDYVNANHIKAAWSNRRYIATQGPIPATFAVSTFSISFTAVDSSHCRQDFWNVVWQQDVRVIVMLTAEKEGGQIKAHNYWSSRKFNNLKLEYLSEHRATIEPERIHRHYSQDHKDRVPNKDQHGQRRATLNDTPPSLKEPPRGEQPYVIVRRFTLSRTDMPFERMREITQLHYSHWPDFGAPAHPAHLLGLVEQCDAVVRSSQGSATVAQAAQRPIVVHCSAGCGRTGTFCTVDSVLDMLRRQRSWKEEKRQQERAVSLDSYQARAKREPTPMDVDATPSLSKDQSRMSVDAGSNRDDFFSAMSISPQTPAPASSSSSSSSLKVQEWLDGDDVDLIEKAVEEFRLQRLSMVQSLRQFVLCYESVLEWFAGQSPKTA